MVRKYGMGFDGGNSMAKGVVFLAGRPVVMVIPSVSTDGSLEKLALKRRADGGEFFSDRDCLDRNEYVLSLKNGSIEKYVGELARTEDPMASSGRGDINRYWSSRIRELALTIAGTKIDDKEYDLYVVTGLPAKTFSEETVKKITNALQGTYTYTLNGRTQVAHVIVSKVLQEGAGASIALASPKKEIEGFIDIGGFSTDLYACEGLKAIGNFIDGVDVGVENILDQIDVWYMRDCRIDVGLAARHRNAILQALSHKGTLPFPTLTVGDKKVSSAQVKEWADDAVLQVGAKINEFVSRTWRSGGRGQVAFDFEKVSIVGGGAYYFEQEVQKIVGKARSTSQPELQNVLGYGVYANRIAERVKAIA